MQMQMENEIVMDCMIKWVQNFDYNINTEE